MLVINLPKVPTYFIGTFRNHTNYGVVRPNTCMTIGFDELETFIDEQIYKQRLNELGIKL